MGIVPYGGFVLWFEQYHIKAFNNPSVNCVDSSLYTREPFVGRGTSPRRGVTRYGAGRLYENAHGGVKYVRAVLAEIIFITAAKQRLGVTRLHYVYIRRLGKKNQLPFV